MKLKRAMVFAAGLGKRMRPLTLERPKPLIEVGGRSMLDRTLDALEAAGVELAVVNSHHLPAQVHDAVRARRRTGRGPDVVLSHEPVLLETGGGLLQVLGLLGREPFVSVNGDVVWLEGPRPALLRLAEAFDPARMDALLLLHARQRAVGYEGAGDFALGQGGALLRTESTPRPLVFTGLQVWHPRAFAGLSPAPFSLGDIYRRRRRQDGVVEGLYGLEHDGEWLHVGRPGDLAPAEAALSVHEQDLPPQ